VMGDDLIISARTTTAGGNVLSLLRDTLKGLGGWGGHRNRAGGKVPGRGRRVSQDVIDEVLRDGFDGIYLDWVEGFENAHVIAAAQAAGKDPALLEKLQQQLGQLEGASSLDEVGPDALGQGAVTKKQLATLAENDPSLVTQLIRSWLSEGA